MKSKLLVIILLLSIQLLISVPVSREDAEISAKNWMKIYSDRSEFKVSEYIDIEGLIHVFNFSEGGFAMLAADDASKPVLGYSHDTHFILTDEQTNTAFWVEMYKEAISEIRSLSLKNTESVKEWESLMNCTLQRKDSKEVQPMLSTTWDQGDPFNMYCPLDGGSRSVVGCVATAMAQIMNYHAYPKHGSSSSSYNVLGQTLSADYFWSTYNFDMMTNTGSAANDLQAHEMAQLSYHAGVSVEMDYGYDGSGAFSNDVPYALETYFKYDTACNYQSRQGYSDSQWQTMILNEIDNARPVYYSGSGDSGGHAFITDGYQTTDYFHFNWGWGGSADGYFYLDTLNPGGSDFSQYQAIVRNITPAPVDIIELPIPDMETSEDQITLDLSEYITSDFGDVISHSVDGSSDINGLTYDITGNILTLTKTGPGLSKIVLVSTTRYDGTFNEFYVKFSDPAPQAGHRMTYNFNGTSYVECPSSDASNTLDNLAISTWFKLDVNNINQGIISKSTSTSNGWYVQIQSNNILKFFVKTEDGIQRKLYSNTLFEADRWYHIDAMYDGKDLRLYVDGEFDNEKTTYTSSSPVQNTPEYDIRIGLVPGIGFNGQLDEIVIWNEPVSQNDMNILLAWGPDTISDSRVVAYWELNEGFGYDITDTKGNHSGTLMYGDLSYWNISSAPIVWNIEKNQYVNTWLKGDPTLEFSLVKEPLLGTFNFINLNECEYTPNTNITGTDSLKYVDKDGVYTSNEVDLIIHIKEPDGINDQLTPTTVTLDQNYPNPFNPETFISFSLSEVAEVKLSVYDNNGQLVRTLVNSSLQSGNHKVLWNGKDNSGRSLSSGVYYYKLSTPDAEMTRKALMIK